MGNGDQHVTYNYASATSERKTPDYRPTPTPQQISEQIEGLPLYQQANARKHYTDLPVEWPAMLCSVQEDEGNRCRVLMTYGHEPRAIQIPKIFCYIDLQNNARLKTALPNQPVTVRGLIDDAKSSSTFRLKDAEIIFERNNEQTLTDVALRSSTNRLGGAGFELGGREDLRSDMQQILQHHCDFALLLIDLDNFKSMNDEFGHSEGDVCLKRAAEIMRAVVGKKGNFYRWGGDEFAVCLHDFSTEEARATAERIRTAVEQENLGGSIHVTTSIGICASDRTDSQSREEILEMADKAMYTSKYSGKNRVTAWPVPTSVFKELKKLE
jgi:diguanylate cyclase (GGDEF)-like protein